MHIALYLDVMDTEEATEVAELFAPWRGRIRKVGPAEARKATYASKWRKQLILEHMPKDSRPIGKLYRHLQRKAVARRSYKTFQRDIYELIAEGKLSCTKHRGGAQGSTTIITLPTTVKG